MEVMFLNLGMIMLYVKLMMKDSLFLEVSLQDQELMIATLEKRMELLLIGKKLVINQNANHVQEIHTLLLIVKANALFLVVKMMIQINFAIYGSLLLKRNNGKKLSCLKEHTNHLEEADTLQIFLMVKCTSLVEF